jgi:hypothetical protein
MIDPLSLFDPHGISEDMGGVPPPADALQTVSDVEKVEEKVDVVHPGPGTGPLVSNGARNLVFLPFQPRQRVVSAAHTTKSEHTQ